MRYARLHPGVAFAVAALLATSAAAAEPERKAPATGTTTAAPSAAQRGGHAPSAASETRISKLIGMNVQDREGKSLGEIKDVVIDANTGEIKYAVLSAGGTLGIGEKRYAMSLARAKPDGKGKLVADFDRAALESAPAFDAPQPAASAAPADVKREAATHARFRRASDVMKTKVRDSRGGTVGSVEDMLVDVQANRVKSVVVKFDRAWSPNDKLVALPMSAFADGATAAEPATAMASASAPPRNTAPSLALLNPSGEPSQGTASAVNPPDAVRTRPPAIEAKPGADVQALERKPLQTTTSYADDENLVYKGTREQLVNAPAFDAKRYGD
jgi:sporulation protein YlmC with PRC-barrel domain